MARDGLGGRLGRGARLARTGARGALGLAGANVRRLAGDDTAQDIAHEELAARLAEVLGEMKGAAMKVGQLLSFVDLDLPDEVRSVYHEALAGLRDQAPPMDPDKIERVIAEDFGEPATAVFAEWNREPLAAASIGQVHEARLHDGRRVAVKVQYPGVADAVRADLRNAETFAPIGRLIAPNQEIGPVLDEIRDRVEDELDYRREAQYQGAFASRYAGHPFIVVPGVVTELCRDRVLVSDLVEGRRFDDVVRDGDEALHQRVGEIIFRYAFGSIGRFRLFNGDPHPGNYLVLGDGRVAFLDYGSVKMFTVERHQQLRAIDDAIIQDDRAAFLGLMRDLRFVPPGVDVDEDMLYEWFRSYSRPTAADQPFTFTPQYAAEVLGTVTDPRSEQANMLRRLNLPGDFVLLNRIQWGLNSILGQLRASNDWRGIRNEYVADGAPATPLGEQDHAWFAQRTAAT